VASVTQHSVFKVIHIYIRTWFIFMAEKHPFYRWAMVCLSDIKWRAWSRLCSAAVSSAAVKACTRVMDGCVYSFLLVVYLGVQWLGHKWPHLLF
jgi:hypothetical protein